MAPTRKNHSNKATGTPGKTETPRFRLQLRDLEVVDAVHRLRVLTTEHLAALYFPTKDGEINSACRTRLRHLTAGGFLHREEQPQVRSDGRRPYLYMLTEAGRDLLVHELGYKPEETDWKPAYLDVSWPFLAHQLAINDTYVALTLAGQRINWQIERWVDDRILKKQHIQRVTLDGDHEGGRSQEVAVVPDAYLLLSGCPPPPQLHFFLEVDRATMAVAATSPRVKSWQQRIRAYRAYFQLGAVQALYGTDRVRVLTVTTGGGERLEHLKKATEAVGGKTRYWFTTAEELTAETALTAPIWRIAGQPGSHILARL